jgi:anaerobic ribonucleoside-triphosphate reductase activating protein
MKEMDNSDTVKKEISREGQIIRVCGVEPESIVDGPGFRYVLFVQGCPHHCHGCHNPESWDPKAGFDMTTGEVFAEIMENPHLRGVTFSGGEPFEQVPALLELAKLVKGAGLTLMSYSGYTLEELENRHDPETDELLSMLDILVDGRYDEKLRNLTLIYCGSENQRVIDMGKTRKARTEGDHGMVVPYKSDYDIDIVI